MVSFHGREALVTLAGHRPQLARGDHEDLLPRQHGDYGEYLVGWGGGGLGLAPTMVSCSTVLYDEWQVMYVFHRWKVK